MDRLRVVVAVVVLAVWAVIYTRAALDKSFTPPAELSGLMIAVVAWMFSGGVASEARRQARANDPRGTDPEDEKRRRRR